jgi:monoterpene epsilon-lactone hydrolase
MASLQHTLLSFYLKVLQRKQSKTKDPLKLRRKLINDVAMKFKLPKELKIERRSANGVPVEWMSFEKPQERIVMYLHGGAYVAGSLQSHRHLVSALAKTCKAEAMAVDYRLAPEHPFPAALDDALSAYLWLIKKHNPQQVIIAGDSAGGGLAVAMIAKLLEDHLALPRAVVLLAPWVDLTGESPTISSVGSQDVILSKEMLASSAQMYAHTHPLNQPYISPIHAVLSGFPTTLIHVGTKDLLLNDSRMLARVLKEQGTKVIFEEWIGAMHVWHFFTYFLPESKRAIKRIGEFVDSAFK